MALATINISLSDPLKAYVDATVEEGAYSTPSEYITGLIAADCDRRRQALEERLLEAFQGDSIALTSDEIERGGILSLLREKMQSRQGRAA